MEQVLDGCRWVYNYFRNRSMTVEDMQFALVELKEQYPWLREYYYAKVLQMVVHQIDAARKSLHTLRSHGRKTGRFLKYSEKYSTFVYNQSGFRIEKHGNTDLLWLSKVGYVQIRLHRGQPSDIKQISVTKKPSGRWFANVVCEEVRRPVPRIDTYKSVDIDVGIKNFIYNSDGRSVPNPRFLAKMLKPLRRADRRIARRQIGSRNYDKANT